MLSPSEIKPGDLLRRNGINYLIIERWERSYFALTWWQDTPRKLDTTTFLLEWMDLPHYSVTAYAKVVRGKLRASKWTSYRYFAIYLPRHKEPIIVAGCRVWRGFDAAISWYKNKGYYQPKRDASLKIIRDLKTKCRSVKWPPKAKRKGAR